MNERAELDLTQAPSPGRFLVESGAGTGKTYSIAVLFCWFVVGFLEDIERVLVVTFTEAATAELKERIYQFLAESEKILADETYESDNPSLVTLCRDFITESDRRLHRLHVSNSLKNFDRVPVYTIHGFCSRILSRHAFETSSVLGSTVTGDEKSITELITGDFWRKYFYNCDPLLYSFLCDGGINRNMLIPLYGRFSNRFDAHLLPDTGGTGADTVLADLNKAVARVRIGYEQFRSLWLKSSAEVTKLFSREEMFNKRYFSKGSPLWYISRFHYYTVSSYDISGIILNQAFNELLIKFSTETLHEKGMLKKFADKAPEHPFFDSCEGLSALITETAEYISGRGGELVSVALNEIRERSQIYKNARHILSYGDLITSIDSILSTSRQQNLIDSVAPMFRAVLIDEFQDTDPVQYRIFDSLFSGKAHSLYLIGDPKQAIYSFRGGDIYTYLTASESCSSQFLLSKNRRSNREICDAVNTLFSRDIPFAIKGIDHPESLATKNGYVLIRGERLSPFSFYIQEGGDKAISKTEAGRIFTRACASRVRMLTEAIAKDEAFIEEEGCITRPLSPSDIAVLVRSHHEGRSISEELKALGIPVVEIMPLPLEQTDEYDDIALLLQVLVSPYNRGAVHALLCSRLCGYSIAEISTLAEEQDPAYDALIEQLVCYSRSYYRQHFTALMMKFFADYKVPERILSLKRGERIYTNYMHIIELIHTESLRRSLSPESLFSWYSSWKDEKGAEREQRELRMETDDRAVRIVTIHKSKGLQFPVVFSPFHYSSFIPYRSGRYDPLWYHDSSDRMICDLQEETEGDNTVQSYTEALSEDLRLLYVAITRAQYSCSLFWGNIKRSGTSALSYLLNRDIPGGKEGTARMMEVGDDLDTCDIKGLLAQLFSPDACTIASMPELEAGTAGTGSTIPSLECREFRGSIDNSFRISSYSFLTAQHDRDDTWDVPVLPVTCDDERVLPPGAGSGLVLHEIFEKISFTEYKENLSQTVQSVLVNYGLNEIYQEYTEDLVCRVLDTVLPGLGHSLKILPDSSCIKEMEFYLAAGNYTPASIGETICSWYPEYTGRGFLKSPVKLSGFLKGFIDLVFESGGKYYIADWKSNFLGGDEISYNEKNISRAMYEHGYHIQYLFYLLALRRYLRQRISDYSDERLGGVYYFFIRGMGKERGIYYDKPPAACLDALEEVFKL